MTPVRAAVMIRPVGPDDLPPIDPRLAGPLFDRPTRARGWVATTAGRRIGHLLTAPLFATWQAADTLDVHQLHLADPDDRETADALLAVARRHAAAHRLTGVRWFQHHDERTPFTARTGADQRGKLRFTRTLAGDPIAGSSNSRRGRRYGVPDPARHPGGPA